MKEGDAKTKKGRVWYSAFGKLMKGKGISIEKERWLCFWGLLCCGIEYSKREGNCLQRFICDGLKLKRVGV